ncbi:MAG: hypothetical protein Q9193_005931 [Seirophora villosa]
MEKHRHECAESGDDEDEEFGKCQSRARSPQSRIPRGSKLSIEMMRTNSRGSVTSECAPPVPLHSANEDGAAVRPSEPPILETGIEGEGSATITPPEIFPKQVGTHNMIIDMDATPKPSTMGGQQGGREFQANSDQKSPSISRPGVCEITNDLRCSLELMRASKLIQDRRADATLKNASLISRTFLHIVSEFLFHTITIPLIWDAEFDYGARLLSHLQSSDGQRQRSLIKHIKIPMPHRHWHRSDPEYTALQLHLEFLLRESPNLQTISFHLYLHPYIDSNIPPPIVECIQKLEKPIELLLSARPSEQLSETVLKLQTCSRIKSLELDFYSDRERENSENSMACISTTIGRSPWLRSFALRAEPFNEYKPEDFAVLYNLPFLIPGSFKQLQHLHIHGRYRFQPADWAIWDSCVDWANIHTLELVEISLVVEVLTHLMMSLASLRTLRLSAYRIWSDCYRLGLLHSHSCSIVQEFLRAHSLEELDIIGFPREISVQDMVHGSGSRLRKLRIHVNTGLMPLAIGQDVFTGPEKLQRILSACPLLECLGFDAESQQADLIMVSVGIL